MHEATADFDGQRQLFISLEGVHTEPDDADGGLMLKIPRFIRPSTTPADEIREHFETAGYSLATQHKFLERQNFQIFVIRSDEPES